MDGSDAAAAAPFPFSDLRMMFIELRGASTIDRPVPVPVPVTASPPPLSPNSQYKKELASFRVGRGRSSCQTLTRHLTGVLL